MSAVITAPSRQAVPAEEQPRLRIVRISRLEDLQTIEPAWQALADRAVEPNVFYEPWMMLPALRQFHAKTRFEIYTVYADFLNDSRLVAFVPFEREAWAFGLRSRRRRLLRYYYCALCTPLLDREFGSDAMAELLPELRSSGGLYEFSHVNADGPVMQAIVAALGENGVAKRRKSSPVHFLHRTLALQTIWQRRSSGKGYVPCRRVKSSCMSRARFATTG